MRFQVIHRSWYTCSKPARAGGSWRGFDPTHGEPVVGDHVALAAAARPEDAAPIEGS